jgi:hypothetical protein
MRPSRTITYRSAGTPRVSAKESRERFVVETSPIWGLPQPALAPTASLALLDDETVKHGDVCPMCFIEQALTGACGGCE